jgi:hypothetical protein
MKSERDKQRYREWRQNNPDKVREQRKRRYARSIGLLPPYEKPAPLTDEQLREKAIAKKKLEYQRRKERLATDPEYAEKFRAKERARGARRYAKLLADPEKRAQKLEQERIRNRIKKGIPLDAPVMTKGLTAEQRAERHAEKERLKAERAAARPPRKTPEERKARRHEWQKEYDRKKRDLARARRAAEVANDMARYPSSFEPKKVCPDPPELQALFKKASKGEPPYERFTGKKMGAFTARAKWI